MYMNGRLMEAFGKEHNVKEEKKKIAHLERNNKNIQENLEQLEKEYDKVAPIIESAEEYSQTEKFISFLDGLEKKNDLEVNLFLMTVERANTWVSALLEIDL